MVSVVVGETGFTEREVRSMRLKKVFAYEHCFYAKKGVKCRPRQVGESIEDLVFM